MDGLVKLKSEGNEAKERATQAYKPGFVSLSLYRNKNGDHLSSLLSGPKAAGFPRWAGRCCHRGRAANPGTGRAPTVPLFGLAPGGVWPSLRHRRRPDALTVRFHPYPPIAGRTVCFCATFRPPQWPRRIGTLRGSLGVTQHPARWSPDFPPRRPRRIGALAAVTRPAWLSFAI